MLALFDLEGPLSPQDNCVDLFTHFYGPTSNLFRALDRYDDLSALGGGAPYEPGTTLALSLPFLVAKGMDTDALHEVSVECSTLQPGARDLIQDLIDDGATPNIITTSYEIHAVYVASLLGVAASDVHATTIPPGLLSMYAEPGVVAATQEVVDALEEGASIGDRELAERLDEFFGAELPSAGAPDPRTTIHARGGRRKAMAAEALLRKHGQVLEGSVFIGDSITDVAIMQFVDAAGGLTIAFNGDSFALGVATVGVSGASVEHVRPALRAWAEGGLAEVHRMCTDVEDPLALTWLPDARAGGSRMDALIARHSEEKHQLRRSARRLS